MDSIKAARLYRQMRGRSQSKLSHHAHVPHSVTPFDMYDPSLTNQMAYGNRADWHAAAAMNGFVDVDIPAEKGSRRYLTPPELESIVAGSVKHKKNGMKLY